MDRPSSFLCVKVEKMNVLVLGSGGREHAIAWKLSNSSQLDQLYIAPGNAGTKSVGENVPLDPMNFEEVKSFCLENDVNIVVVGPEQPLVAGIADFFESDAELRNVTLIGPNKKAAQLEGSKDFAKNFMMRNNIPTAKYATFTKKTLKEGYAFLESMNAPYVLKADGLAAGKGVLIIDNLAEAKASLKEILSDKKFGEAGAKVVIEQFLSGVEMSCFILTDGKSYKILPSAKDYKRIGEGDTGLNTGGMGAVSPVPFLNSDYMDLVETRIIKPTIKGLALDGIHYQGFIFFGLINVKGEPYVIEYNCRMGDPETEVVMPRLKSDLLDLFEGIATNTLSERDVDIDPRTAITVMMVSGGYPEAYEKGKPISGITGVQDALVFHAGTREESGRVFTNGGRVLAVTAYGKDIERATQAAYNNLSLISFENANYREDIGQDLMREKKVK